MKKHLYFLVLWLLMLVVHCPVTTIAQIFAPEGLNMPGDWNGWTNYPAAGSVFRSGTLVPAGQINLITTGDRRWQTAINCQSSGGNVTPNTTYQFLFTSGPASGPWNNAWRNTTVQMNTIQNYNFTGGGANNSITFGAAGTYTMNWRDNGYANTSAIFMYTANAPVTMSGWSQNPAAGAIGGNQAVNVNVNFSAAPSPQELFYVRYTTNNFASSTIIPITVNGTTGSATIPGLPTNTNVQYYIFSTTVNNPSSNFDMVTLRFLNNGGLNYSYTVGALVWNSVASGNWSNPATWSAGVMPDSNAVVTITSGHTVTLDTNAHVSSFTIQSGATFVGSDNRVRTISIPNNVVIVNNGTISAATGSTFQLLGRAVFSGNAVALHHVNAAGELDVPTGSTLSGTLRLNPGAFLTRALTYQVGSTLEYTQNYGRYNEWLTGSSGPGVPWNVQINSGVTLNMNGNNTEAFVRGNLILNGTIGLSNQSGGNLVILGNYQAGASSSLLTNTRSVIFRGNSAQQVGKSTVSGEIFGTLVVDNPAGLTLTSPVQINATLQLSQGQLNNSSHALTFVAGTNLSRSGGSLSQTPVYLDSINLEYASSITPGVEWPTAFDKIRNLTVTNGGTLTLNANRTVNRTLDCSGGSVVLASGANLQLNGTLTGTAISGLENSTLTLGGLSNAAATLSPAGPLCNLSINRAAVVNLGSSFTLEGNLTLNAGQLRSSGARTITFSGRYGSDSLTSITFNGGALEGTNQGVGNDLAIMASQGTLVVQGSISTTQNSDHKVFSLTVQPSARLDLRTGLLVRHGVFTINGQLIMGNGGSLETQPSGSITPVYHTSTGRLRYQATNVEQNIEWPLNNGPAEVSVAGGAMVRLLQSRTTGTLRINSGGTLQLDAPLLVSNGGLINGLLQVNANQSLSLTGTALQVAGAGQVRLEDGASMLDQEAVLGGGGSLNGSLTVRRQGSTSNLKYNFWSSPVAGSTIGVLGSTDLRRFDATTQSWVPSNFSENLPSNTPMQFGIGYTASNSGLVQFQGSANNANTDVNLSLNPGVNDDWNLLGNPYPSAIQGQTFLTDNAGRINGAVYFWDRSFVYGANNSQNSFSGADYVARNLTSGAFVIPSCQGFFVEAVGAQARFRNQQRIANGATLFRQQTDETERAFFTLSNQNRQSACLIGFNPAATDGYDPLWDAKKMFGQSELQLYSLLNGKAFDIQGLGALTTSVQVPIGVMASKSGMVQFKWEKKENWKNAEVWLEDKKLQRFTLLNEKPVSLELAAGTEEQRFVLHFRPNATIQPIGPGFNSDLKVWANSGFLTVENWGTQKLSGIALYEVNGRKVWEEINPGESGRLVRSLNLPAGVYILRIEGAGQTEIRKISW